MNTVSEPSPVAYSLNKVNESFTVRLRSTFSPGGGRGTGAGEGIPLSAAALWQLW